MITRDEVAWCQRKMNQFDEDVAVLSNEFARQKDFFAEVAAVWQDSAGRRVQHLFLEPFSKSVSDGAQSLIRQAAALVGTTACLRDSLEPSYAILSASDRSASLRKKVEAAADSARYAADTANRYSADAKSHASEAVRLLQSL